MDSDETTVNMILTKLYLHCSFNTSLEQELQKVSLKYVCQPVSVTGYLKYWGKAVFFF